MWSEVLKSLVRIGLSVLLIVGLQRLHDGGLLPGDFAIGAAFVCGALVYSLLD